MSHLKSPEKHNPSSYQQVVAETPKASKWGVQRENMESPPTSQNIVTTQPRRGQNIRRDNTGRNRYDDLEWYEVCTPYYTNKDNCCTYFLCNLFCHPLSILGECIHNVCCCPKAHDRNERRNTRRPIVTNAAAAAYTRRARRSSYDTNTDYYYNTDHHHHHYYRDDDVTINDVVFNSNNSGINDGNRVDICVVKPGGIGMHSSPRNRADNDTGGFDDSVCHVISEGNKDRDNDNKAYGDTRGAHHTSGGYTGGSHDTGGCYTGGSHDTGGGYTGSSHDTGGGHTGSSHDTGGGHTGSSHDTGGGDTGGSHDTGGGDTGGSCDTGGGGDSGGCDSGGGGCDD